MQHCEECGSELRANARFCGHCGRKIANENELDTGFSNAPIEDIPMSPTVISMTLTESQDSALEDGEEEKQQTPVLPSENNVEEEENNVEEEEQTSYLTSENDDEEQTPDLASENGEVEDQQTLGPISENEKEEDQQLDFIEPTSSMPVDINPEPDILANQFPDEQPQYTQTPMVAQETQSPYASAQKPISRPVSRCLLFFLAGLVVIAGLVVALIGLFHLNLPGVGGSSNTQSSSSSNEIIKTAGSSLTASVCVKSSTPSTSGAGDGTEFSLFASSGCSSVVAATANSLCLIFPYNAGASHKYIFDASNAAIDSKPYHLILGVAEYTGPATYNDAQHISVGISEGSTGKNFSWLYRSGSVTINNDQQSGTMDVILQSVSGGNTIHVVGDWSCGRQMKNT